MECNNGTLRKAGENLDFTLPPPTGEQSIHPPANAKEERNRANTLLISRPCALVLDPSPADFDPWLGANLPEAAAPLKRLRQSPPRWPPGPASAESAKTSPALASKPETPGF